MNGLLDKFTLRSFVVVTGWVGLMCFIFYAIYKNPDLIEKTFDVAFGTAITIISFAVGRWLFREGGG
jgi:uncharacterized BrkB/YihY/UPF0761 family membrane protein